MLNQVDPTVRRETVFIAGVVLVCSAVMQLVFLLAGAWNLTVLWGNLLSGGAAVLNFFLMGLSIQKALNKDPKAASTQMKASQSLRLLMLALAAALGAVANCFNLVAVVIPLLFPRIGVSIRGLQGKAQGKEQ